MRKQIALIILILLCTGVAEAQLSSNLESLYRSHSWFDLRDAVRAPKSSSFYKSVTACAFNDLWQCRREAQSVIRADPSSEQAYLAHEALGYLYFRSGNYRKALAEIEAQLALKPDKTDLQSGRALLLALSETPELVVEHRQVSRLRYDPKEAGLFIPLSINGKQARYFFDTGLNVSLLSESEAKRLGLVVREVAPEAAKLFGNAGGQIRFRIAVAATLKVG